MLRIVFFKISCVIFMLSACQKKQKVGLPFYNTPDFTPHFISTLKAKQAIPHSIPSFAYTNQDHQKITDKNVTGKIHIASFIFTSCSSICPVMIENLKMVSDVYEKKSDVVLLSFSVTPWIDTPERLKEFKNKYHIQNPNWHFLTGNKNDIYKLARKAYFAEEDLGYTKDSTNFLHTEHIILADKSKKIRGIYNGTLQTDMMQLIDDVATLREEQQ